MAKTPGGGRRDHAPKVGAFEVGSKFSVNRERVGAIELGHQDGYELSKVDEAKVEEGGCDASS